jgi:hypothetical protein
MQIISWSISKEARVAYRNINNIPVSLLIFLESTYLTVPGKCFTDDSIDLLILLKLCRDPLSYQLF